MTSRVEHIPVPHNSMIHHEIQGASFYDCHRISLGTSDAPALALYLKTMGKTPAWVDRLMGLRNTVVQWVGLKDLGALSKIDPSRPLNSYVVGDRIGIFTLLAVSDQEVILGDSDKHLDVKVSVLKQSEGDKHHMAVSTIVHVHNTLGRIYMFFVGPAHKIIAPAVVARFST